MVTLPSSQTVVHLAAGFYRHINVLDCIVSDVKSYADLVYRLGHDVEFNTAIRDKLKKHASKLYEHTGSVKDWETFLQNVAYSK